MASFPSVHLNNGVEQYRTLSWIDDMSAELQKRSRFNQDERLVEETRLRGMVTELLLFKRVIEAASYACNTISLGQDTLDTTSAEETEKHSQRGIRSCSTSRADADRKGFRLLNHAY